MSILSTVDYIGARDDTFGDITTMRQLDDMDNTFRSGIRAIYGRNEAKAANRLFGSVLEQVDTALFFPLLLRRADLCRRLNLLDESLNSAQQAIRLCGANPDGYIAAARALVAQGNIADALRQCRAGLSAVPRGLLRRENLNRLTQLLLWETDKAHQWPLDDVLLGRIISMLQFSDRLRMAATCQHWRNRIHNHPATWQVVAINSNIPDELLQFMKDGAVRKLTICTDGIWRLQTYQLWKQLESLEIIIGTATPASVNLARALVALNSGTLRCLELEMKTASLEPADILNDVLVRCPNLTHLKMYKHPLPFPAGRDTMLLPSQYIALTQLILVNNNDLTAYLKSLIPLCPRLTHLVCVPRGCSNDVSEVLELANKHCPYLQSFRIGLLCDFQSCPDNSLICYHSAVGVGGGMDAAAAQFLAKTHLVLEGLCLPMSAMQPHYQTLITLAHVTAPNLRYLKISNLCHEPRLSSFDTSVVIQSCPALETVQITNAADIDDWVLNSLGQLKRLKELAITIMHNPEKSNTLSLYGISQFFSAASSLRNIHIMLTEPVSVASCLFCIAQSTTLVDLRLSYECDALVRGLDEFSVALHAPLETMQITSTNGLVGMESCTLAPLARMPHLRYAEFGRCLPVVRGKIRDFFRSNQDSNLVLGIWEVGMFLGTTPLLYNAKSRIE